MTAPAITVPPGTGIGDAAALMLAKKIHRLPVTDGEGKLIGIVSRTDIFKPLLNMDASYTMRTDSGAVVSLMSGDEFEEVLRASVSRGPAPATTLPTWQIKYLYDGSCPMCQSLKGVLERQDHARGNIMFVDISASDYSPAQNMGIPLDDAMKTIHAIRRDGSVLTGTEALRAMFSAVGLGWAAALSDLPVFTQIVDAVYDIISKYRLPLSGMLDAVVAAKRLKMSEKGVTTCENVEEECEVIF